MKERWALKLLIIASFPAGALIFFGSTLGLMAVFWGPFEEWMGGDPAGFGIAALMAGIFGAALILLTCFFWLHNFLVKGHHLPAHSALGLIAGPIVTYLVTLNSADLIDSLLPNADVAMILRAVLGLEAAAIAGFLLVAVESWIATQTK